MITARPDIRSIWFDMDGTLAKWNRTATYNRPGTHYFRHVEPDPHLVRLFHELHGMYSPKLHIITNICMEDGLEQEYIPDKETWIREVLPCFLHDIQLLYHPLLGITKADFASGYLSGTLTVRDILVSDSNHDVIPWDDAGGIAFKYSNGINDPKSYEGPKLYPPADTRLDRFLEKITVCQKTRNNK